MREKEKKVSHGGTANTAGGEKWSQVCVLWSLCRCERKREEGVSRRHGEHGEGRKVESGLCAVSAVSL